MLLGKHSGLRDLWGGISHQAPTRKRRRRREAHCSHSADSRSKVEIADVERSPDVWICTLEPEAKSTKEAAGEAYEAEEAEEKEGNQMMNLCSRWSDSARNELLYVTGRCVGNE